MSSLVVNQKWTSENQQTPPGFGSSVLGYLKTSGGAGKAVQLIQKPLKLINHLVTNPSPLSLQCEANLSIAGKASVFPRIPGDTIAAQKDWSALSADDGVSTMRKISKAIGSIFGAVSTYCCAILFVKPVPMAGSIAQAVDLTSDLATLPYDYSDYREAANFESRTTSEVQKAFAHSRKYYMLCVAKDILSIVSAVLGVALFHITPVAGFILMSLAGTILAISKDLLKANGEYPVISFERGVQAS